jgi:dTDP-4-amino-4,6-dideoxygalactose transaminase
MGIAQLARLDVMRDRRAMIAEHFSTAFRDVPGLVVPTSRLGVGHSWHIYALRLDLDRLSITRDRFIDELRERGIGVSVHFMPLHLHPYYREMYDLKPEDFPVAHREFMREISLPIYSAMTDSDIDRVISAVLDVAHKYKR